MSRPDDPGHLEGEEPTEVHAAVPADPFAPPAADDAAPGADEPAPPDELDAPVAPAGQEFAEPRPLEVSSPEPTATVSPSEATPDAPAGTAAAGDDWLAPEASVPEPVAAPVEEPGTPEPDPVIRTPDAFTPLGTPEPGASSAAGAAQEKVAGAQEALGGVQAKAQEFLDKPEGKVAAAFAGGVVASFLLRALGR